MTVLLPSDRKRKRAGSLPEFVPSGEEMVTLTELPANRSPFKVVRSAKTSEGDQDMEPISKTQRSNRRRRVAQRRTDGLISIEMPEGATADEAQSVIEKFGLEDNFSVLNGEDGAVLIVRNDIDLKDYQDVGYLPLGQDLKAVIDRSIFASQRSDKEHLTVTRIEFDGHDAATVEAWLTENEVDFQKNGVEVVEGGVIVRRHDDGDHKTVKVSIDEGVTAYVARSDESDVPVKINRSVTDAAFGSFGFGHVDFSAAMVDPEFSMIADNAIMQLREVLDNIMFFSQTELADRKRLYKEATDQFVAFMDDLIDGLPSTVRAAAEAVVRSDTLTRRFEAAESGETQETQTMINVSASKKASRGDAESKDGDAATKDEVTKDTGAAGDEEVTIKRSELDDMVAKAAAAAVETAMAARSETEDNDDESASTDATTQEDLGLGGKLDQLIAGIARNDEMFANLTKQVGEQGKAVEKLQGETVARSDHDDDEDDQPAAPRDAFDGMFGNVHGRLNRTA